MGGGDVCILTFFYLAFYSVRYIYKYHAILIENYRNRHFRNSKFLHIEDGPFYLFEGT